MRGVLEAERLFTPSCSPNVPFSGSAALEGSQNAGVKGCTGSVGTKTFLCTMENCSIFAIVEASNSRLSHASVLQWPTQRCRSSAGVHMTRDSR